MTEENASIPELASALRPVLLRLARRLRQMRDPAVELSGNQLSALGVLLMSGDLPIGELAARELVQPPSMTRIVSALEQRGLVQRTPDPTDRRQSRVGLTENGREILLANRRRRDAWLAVRLATLSASERDLLRRAIPVLEKVNAA